MLAILDVSAAPPLLGRPDHATLRRIHLPIILRSSEPRLLGVSKISYR